MQSLFLSKVTANKPLLLKMEPTQCSETSAFNTQTPGKYPEDNSSLPQHGESLKSRTIKHVCEQPVINIQQVGLL
jgi:hypothetical protein